jgi:DNA-binding transcriptional ArsR family regulator
MVDKKIIKVLKALSDGTRLKIVEFLLDGEKCVCEIFPHVKRTQSTTSIQLSILEKVGILNSRRDGKKVFYKIKDPRVYYIFKALGYNSSKLAKLKCCCRK